MSIKKMTTKHFKIFTLLAGMIVSTQANAASVGNISFDDNAVANNLISANGFTTHDGAELHYASGTDWHLYVGNNTYVSTAPLNDATDNSVSTYLAAHTNPFGPFSMQLGFDDATIVNGDGADIAFFFLWDQSLNTASVSINNMSQALSTTILKNSDGSEYLANNVAWDGNPQNNVRVMVGLLDLTSFGFESGQVLQESIQIELLSGANSLSPTALSMVAGLNTTVAPIPLPAPLLLFISGLALLGISRRTTN